MIGHAEPQRFRCEATTTRKKQCRQWASHLQVTVIPGGDTPWPKVFMCEQHWQIYMDKVEGVRPS
jgi:hypothetical protein